MVEEAAEAMVKLKHSQQFLISRLVDENTLRLNYYFLKGLFHTRSIPDSVQTEDKV